MRVRCLRAGAVGPAGVPRWCSAQGSITGTVRDSSGAVLPGVTVEAASPVLIEKVRSVVSDGTGQYRIVDLRPGTYTVTFSLTGFGTVRQEGIELTGSFTATVNAELKVGAVEETVTVTGRVADSSTCRPRSSSACSPSEVVDAIPAGRSYMNSVGAGARRHGHAGGTRLGDGRRRHHQPADGVDPDPRRPRHRHARDDRRRSHRQRAGDVVGHQLRAQSGQPRRK